VPDTQVSPTLETVDGELLNVDEFDARCVEFYAKLQELTSSISTVRSEFKAIEKVWAKRIKTATKTSGKKKKKSGNRAPSGFVKPTKISDELASFLNKPTGTEMARTEVTREINQYIRANQLQDATNGRKINADQKLSTLLHLPAEDELTYFNLQKYMSVHFPKTPVV
jgi:chromatin remodeling complex protein RSC6